MQDTQAIDRKTSQLLFGVVSHPEAIKERLKKLDKEIDIDRALMFLYSSTVFLELLVTLKKSRKSWLWVPLIQTPFMLMQAAFRWSPFFPMLRKLGFRSQQEINKEREILLDFLNDADLFEEWNMHGNA